MNNIWCERGAYVSKRIRKKMTNFNPLSIKKIAVIRHAALGDMIITRVFLRELKKFFPNAEVTFSMVDKYLYGKPEDLYDKEHIYYRKKGLLKKIESINCFNNLIYSNYMIIEYVKKVGIKKDAESTASFFAL